MPYLEELTDKEMQQIKAGSAKLAGVGPGIVATSPIERMLLRAIVRIENEQAKHIMTVIGCTVCGLGRRPRDLAQLDGKWICAGCAVKKVEALQAKYQKVSNDDGSY